MQHFNFFKTRILILIWGVTILNEFCMIAHQKIKMQLQKIWERKNKISFYSRAIFELVHDSSFKGVQYFLGTTYCF